MKNLVGFRRVFQHLVKANFPPDVCKERGKKKKKKEAYFYSIESSAASKSLSSESPLSAFSG